ncbi:MAG: Flp pilus assembly protein CpaB [Pseudomonadota bacterium]
MNIARIAVLSVALGAGGLAAILASGGSETVQETVVVQEVDATEVLVAANDIGMGTGLSTSDLRWQAWPSDLSNARYITRDSRPGALEELSGAISRQSFLAGEPINEGKLVYSDRGFMSAILPKGMRAISTEISPESGAGGFILPNDRVDVILTKRENSADETGADPFVSQTILGNVRVLAIDQTIEEQDGRQVVVGSTATLELKPEQSEILALAEELGDISLALRSLEDFEVDGDNGPQIIGDGIGNDREKAGSITVVKFGRSQQVQSR